MDERKSVAHNTKLVLKSFGQLLEQEHKSPSQDSQVPTAEIADNFARFKIWSGNIGAYHAISDARSADYRLRDVPEITDRVLGLLQELVEVNDEISELLFGDRQDALLQIDSDDDSDGQSHELVEADEGVSEIEEMCLEAGDIISGLMKISMLVRKATGRDRYAKAAATTRDPLPLAFAAYDEQHVRSKFPKLETTPGLLSRLAKAITTRRQFLRYSANHHQNIAQEPAPAIPSVRDPLPVISLAPRSLMVPGAPSIAGASQVSEQSQIPTEASTIDVVQAGKFDLQRLESADEDDTRSHTTSFASSRADELDGDSIGVPRLEHISDDRRQFECPYCWSMVEFVRQRAWIKHVYRDLRAYTCTFLDCSEGLFEDREHWFEHELEQHRREWLCVSCPGLIFTARITFEKHLNRNHFTEEKTGSLIALTLESSSRPVTEVAASSCPFCNDWDQVLRQEAADTESKIPDDNEIMVPTEQFKRHLGRHMEQLALFAILPNFGAESDATSHRSDSSDGSREVSGTQLLDDWHAEVSTDGEIQPPPIDDEDSESEESDEASRPPHSRVEVFEDNLPSQPVLMVTPSDLENMSEVATKVAARFVEQHGHDVPEKVINHLRRLSSAAYVLSRKLRDRTTTMNPLLQNAEILETVFQSTDRMLRDLTLTLRETLDVDIDQLDPTSLSYQWTPIAHGLYQLELLILIHRIAISRLSEWKDTQQPRDLSDFRTFCSRLSKLYEQSSMMGNRALLLHSFRAFPEDPIPLDDYQATKSETWRSEVSHSLQGPRSSEDALQPLRPTQRPADSSYSYYDAEMDKWVNTRRFATTSIGKQPSEPPRLDALQTKSKSRTDERKDAPPVPPIQSYNEDLYASMYGRVGDKVSLNSSRASWLGGWKIEKLNDDGTYDLTAYGRKKTGVARNEFRLASSRSARASNNV